MASEIANLVVEITADSKTLSTELAKANTQVDNFAAKATKSFALVGTAIATAAVAAGTVLVKNLVDTIEKLDKLGETAEAVGLTTAALQKLQFQAEQAGSSADSVAQSFGFMLNSISDAASGSQPLIQAFNQLGLNANQLKQLRPEQQFAAIAQGFQNIGNAADKVSLARSIFGRGGIDQINLLNSSLKDSSALFDKLGLGITTSQQKAIDEFDKSKKVFGSVFDDFKDKVAAGVTPAFEAVIGGINQTIAQFGGLGNVAEAVATGIVKGIQGVAEGLELLERPFKALGVVAEGVKLAGTNIGVTIGQLVHGQEVGKAAFEGTGTLPLPGDESSQREQQISNDILDTQAGKLQKGIEGFSKLDTTSKYEVLLNNIAKGFDRAGDSAQKAAQKIQSFATITDAQGRSITIQGTSTSKGGPTSGLATPTADEARATQAALDAYKKTGMLPDDPGALSQISKGQFSLFNSPTAAAPTRSNTTGTTSGSFGTISDASGKQLSVGSPPPQKVEVTVTPDKQAFIETVVNSPQMNDKISAISKSSTIDAATVDPRGKN